MENTVTRRYLTDPATVVVDADNSQRSLGEGSADSYDDPNAVSAVSSNANFNNRYDRCVQLYRTGSTDSVLK